MFDSIESFDTWTDLRTAIDKPIGSAYRVTELTQLQKEPYSAFREYLLQLQIEEVADVVSLCELSSAQIKRVIDGFTPVERAQIEPLMSQPTSREEMNYQGGRIAQVIGPNDAAWYFLNGKQEDRISNAVVNLNHYFKDDVDAIFYSGTVYFKGKAYPFITSDDELKSDPIGAIMRAVGDACGEIPKIRMTYSAQLWDFIWEFSKDVKTLRTLTRVGWDKQMHEFITPSFTIRDRQFYSDTSLGIAGMVPCAGLEIPDDIPAVDMRNALQANVTNGALWATLAAVAENVIGRTNGQQPRGIAIVGQLGEEAATKVAEDLGLLTFTGRRANEEIKSFDRSQAQHDLPVMITDMGQQILMPTNIAAWLVMAGPKNAMITLTSSQSATAELYGNWIVVDTTVNVGTYHSGDLSAASLLMHYIAYRQPLPSRAMIDAVETLEDMLNWAEHVAQGSADCRDIAKSMLRDTGRISNGARFVRLIGQLMSPGQLNHDYDVAPGNAAVVIHMAQQAVYVSKSQLLKALFQQGLPIPEPDAIAASLREDGALLGETGEGGDMWVIGHEYWENEIEQWAKAQP